MVLKGGENMGEQITPEAVGKEVGVRADLRRGLPQPREIQTQHAQLAKRTGAGTRKNIKVPISKKLSDTE
jgi:hypothetical protein